MKAKRPRPGDAGSAAVEFALVLPVLMLLIFAVVDFGRMLSAKITVTEAAREGARAAALVGADQGAQRVYAATSDLDNRAVTPEVAGCDDSTPDATATVTYRFTFLTPVGFLFRDDHVDLVAIGIMPCLG